MFVVVVVVTGINVVVVVVVDVFVNFIICFLGAHPCRMNSGTVGLGLVVILVLVGVFVEVEVGAFVVVEVVVPAGPTSSVRVEKVVPLKNSVIPGVVLLL